MSSRYESVHRVETLAGPGDARPTALQIIQDNDLVGQWQDKVILITGCSSGIGIETARALKATGAKIYACVRDEKKGRDALDFLEPSRVELLRLDLNSLDSVRDCAAEFLKKAARLNVLINNAGVMNIPTRTLTKDGFETQFGVNHLAHFLLFQLLRPALLKASTKGFQSRVVNVSSMGHHCSPVHLDDLNLEKPGVYSPSVAYGNSKTANIYMANEIERRYGSEGLHAWSLHPGGIETGLQVHSEDIIQAMKKPEIIRIMKSPEQGAATSVWAAVDKSLEGLGGKYLDDCQIALPKEEATGPGGGHAAWVYNEDAEKTLWEKSCTLCGVKDD